MSRPWARIGSPRDDDFAVVRANNYHRRGLCVGLARSTQSVRPSATSPKSKLNTAMSPAKNHGSIAELRTSPGSNRGSGPDDQPTNRSVSLGLYSLTNKPGDALCDVSLAYSLSHHAAASIYHLWQLAQGGHGSGRHQPPGLAQLLLQTDTHTHTHTSTQAHTHTDPQERLLRVR